MEGCLCVKNGECRKQTHTVPTICRGRIGSGEYPCPVDGERPDKVRCAKECAHRDDPHLIRVFLGATEEGCGAGIHQKMSDEEKVDFKQKMAEIDVVGANDMQSASSSLTPV